MSGTRFGGGPEETWGWHAPTLPWLWLLFCPTGCFPCSWSACSWPSAYLWLLQSSVPPSTTLNSYTFCCYMYFLRRPTTTLHMHREGFSLWSASSCTPPDIPLTPSIKQARTMTCKPAPLSWGVGSMKEEACRVWAAGRWPAVLHSCPRTPNTCRTGTVLWHSQWPPAPAQAGAYSLSSSQTKILSSSPVFMSLLTMLSVQREIKSRYARLALNQSAGAVTQ